MKKLRVILLCLSFLVYLNASTITDTSGSSEDKKANISQIINQFTQDEAENQIRYKELISWLDKVALNVKNKTNKDYSDLIDIFRDKQLHIINENVFATSNSLDRMSTNGNLTEITSSGVIKNEGDIIIVKGDCEISFADNSIILCTDNLDIAHSKNNMVFSDKYVALAHDGSSYLNIRGSIIYSENKIDISHTYDSVLLFSNELNVGFRGNNDCINTIEKSSCNNLKDTQDYSFSPTIIPQPETEKIVNPLDLIIQKFITMNINKDEENQIKYNDILSLIEKISKKTDRLTESKHSEILSNLYSDRVYAINKKVYSSSSSVDNNFTDGIHKTSYINNNVLLVNGDCYISYAYDSIILCTGNLHISHGNNNIVFSNKDIDISHDGSNYENKDGSLIYSKNNIEVAHSYKSIFAFADSLNISFFNESKCINTNETNTLDKCKNIIKTEELIENDYSLENKDINQILASPVDTALYFCNSFKNLEFTDSKKFLYKNSKRIKRLEKRINKKPELREKLLNKFSSKTCKIKRINEKANATFIKLEGIKKLKLKKFDNTWKIMKF